MPGGPCRDIRFLEDWQALAAGRATPRQVHAVAWYLCKRPLRVALAAARDASDHGDAASLAALHGVLTTKVAAGDFGLGDTYPVVLTGRREPLRIKVADWVASAFTVEDGLRVPFAPP